ncbi:MAG: 30S ribosomal protein S20 [Hyphomicrobiaceae bacterium]|nr:30S ribosomal protein S20 [Hyphomicrobiaceae bacterium]
MANTSSAKKAARQTLRRTVINKARRSKMRTEVRRIEEAIAIGDKASAAEALRVAQPIIMRSGQKGVVHSNTASRKLSRLSKRVKQMAESLN